MDAETQRMMDNCLGQYEELGWPPRGGMDADNEFKLTIRLGNEAMQSTTDVAGALHRLMIHLEHADSWPEAADITRIRDRNGNTVGEWSVS